MNVRCEPTNHSFDLHRERDLLWCAKCGTTEHLGTPDGLSDEIYIDGIHYARVTDA